VVGITEVEVATAAAIMALLAKGNASRVQAPTAANETSSRSHAVLQVVVENRETAKQGAQGALAKIKVSLAQSLAKLQLSFGSEARLR
jgi:kinesin family protein 18/19